MGKQEHSDWGRRTGRTAEEKRKAYFEGLSAKKQKEALLYIDKEGKLVGNNTPTTIPKEFKPLLKFKFFCKYCNNYHSQPAGSTYCEKNPDRQKNLDAIKYKSAHYYHEKGRKQKIEHGNNVKRENITAGLRKYKKLETQNGKKKRKPYKARTTVRVIQKEIKPEKMIKSLEKEKLIMPSFFDHSYSTKTTNFNRDEFLSSDNITNRHYDINGDFDPFA